MRSECVDILVIGAGAAGLASAIFAAEHAREIGVAARVEVVDGARTVGAKILVSGGGRCNVTHRQVGPEDFNGTRVLIRNVLAAFPVPKTIAWFASLGVTLKVEETGKLFPNTDRSRTVLDALLLRCADLGVAIRPRSKAVGFVEDKVVLDGGASIAYRRLILCAGGRSLPKSGSDGSGYALARAAGHSVTETVPALVPLRLAQGMFHAELSGISHPVALTTSAGARTLDRREGDLLWTHFGVSGPVVLDASRHWIAAEAQGLQPSLTCSFFPHASPENLTAWLLEAARSTPRRSVARFLQGRLPERVGSVLLREVGVAGDAMMASITREERQRILAILLSCRLPVAGDRGWNYAEATAGGVPLEEVDFRTMQSKLRPTLFLAGEILDVDGRIGGFNFQWAWASGRIAGRAAARSLA